jgi:hypothetical protein
MPPPRTGPRTSISIARRVTVPSRRIVLMPRIPGTTRWAVSTPHCWTGLYTGTLRRMALARGGARPGAHRHRPFSCRLRVPRQSRRASRSKRLASGKTRPRRWRSSPPTTGERVHEQVITVDSASCSDDQVVSNGDAAAHPDWPARVLAYPAHPAFGVRVPGPSASRLWDGRRTGRMGRLGGDVLGPRG